MKALICIAALVAASQANAGCFSEGVRVGTIQKFSQKGLINKSWEGELVMDGVKLKSGQNGLRGGNVWKFSVLDPEVAKAIDGATLSGNPVALKYCQVYMTLAQTDTPYRITQAVERK